MQKSMKIDAWAGLGALQQTHATNTRSPQGLFSSHPTTLTYRDREREREIIYVRGVGWALVSEHG